MVAVEGGKKTPAGELFNDVPDRIADPLLILGAGFVTTSALGMTLAWLCALLAVLTAYIRVLGVSIGGEADFQGPMAKQHRMALLTLSLLFIAALSLFDELQPFRIHHGSHLNRHADWAGTHGLATLTAHLSIPCGACILVRSSR